MLSLTMYPLPPLWRTLGFVLWAWTWVLFLFVPSFFSSLGWVLCLMCLLGFHHDSFDVVLDMRVCLCHITMGVARKLCCSWWELQRKDRCWLAFILSLRSHISVFGNLALKLHKDLNLWLSMELKSSSLKFWLSFKKQNTFSHHIFTQIYELQESGNLGLGVWNLFAFNARWQNGCPKSHVGLT